MTTRDILQKMPGYEATMEDVKRIGAMSHLCRMDATTAEFQTDAEGILRLTRLVLGDVERIKSLDLELLSDAIRATLQVKET